MAFKMRGHTLPGINQRGNENMGDGRSKSSAFQKEPPKYKPFADYKDYEGPAGWIRNTAKVVGHKVKSAISRKKKRN